MATNFKILFNEITPKMHIFCAMYMLGVTCFFNIVALDGLIIEYEGHKNIAEVLSEIHNP